MCLLQTISIRPQHFELTTAPLSELQKYAATIRYNQYGNIITFSPKVFIPLTKLCRDECGYCTFTQPPKSNKAAYMNEMQVLEVATIGAQYGCSEALFTLGDKPELKYSIAKNELKQKYVFESTTDLVYYMADLVLKQTGLLPHINAGVLSLQEMERLKMVSASQGMMLESLSKNLMQRGGPHFNCPDKSPKKRLQVLNDAGMAGVPFTTGILIGIGETREDRIQALLAIKESHLRYGHIQEVIIQNFKAKAGTKMFAHPEPSLEDLCWTIAVARIILPPEISLQCPPNLSNSDSWKTLIDSGINDWGGISPVTRDHVNPERPWPHLQKIAQVVAESGFNLIPRMCVYPKYSSGWLTQEVQKEALKSMDSEGYLRGSQWYAGQDDQQNDFEIIDQLNIKSKFLNSRKYDWSKVEVDRSGTLLGCAQAQESHTIKLLLDKVQLQKQDLTLDEIEALLQARGADFTLVCETANRIRQAVNGDDVSYVVNRNINYTNVCTYGCRFCAFSKNRPEENIREQPYLVPLQEIGRRTKEAWDRGATEVCMQGGIHPKFTGDTYLQIVQAAKQAVPDIHVHAFSPLEIQQGASTLKWPVHKYLEHLKSAGLGSLPGTAAEVLDDEVRKVLCPDKLNSEDWLQIVECAHSVNLKTTSTIMFGHCDNIRSWANHLVKLRELQKRTGGITEFVPLPFVHMGAPIYNQGSSRRGPTLHECILMHAVARIALHPYISNIQASWVKMGPQNAADLLQAGCNDMGGTLTNESITRAAGAQHGQEIGAHEMDQIIQKIGRNPYQRTTLYQKAVDSQVQKSYNLREIEPLEMVGAFSGKSLSLEKF